MPGSSVSAACHLCHLHSHNHDSLVRTSPLRNSRGRSKSNAKFSGHKHHHSGNGYGSPRDEGVATRRSNSASALARLTDNSHSLPGSRSNSLSRYHREVSIMPDGGDTYGRGMRSSSSTRSLEMNSSIPAILDARTTSLPRVTSLLHHSQTQIHPQPDILVGTMPRSRSGSLSRTAVNMSQDNSHDYYLDMHRQRFKEEKRKHRFNLQTVMLIGCYSLLVMVAIVVGVVLCYQNGWLGLGPPQEISRDIPRTNKTASILDAPGNANSRRNPSSINENFATQDGGTRMLDRDNVRLNSNSNVINHRHTNPETRVPFNVNHRFSQANENQFNNQRNRPNQNQNFVIRVTPPEGNDATQGLENIRKNNSPPNIRQPSLKPNFDNQSPVTHQRNENPGFSGSIVEHSTHTFNQPPRIPSTNDGSFVHGGNLHSQIPVTLQTNIPSNINQNTESRTQNVGRNPILGQITPPFRVKPSIREGSVDSNTIAKTLLQAGFPSQSRPIRPIQSLNSGQILAESKSKPSATASSIESSLTDGILVKDSESLTTQELLDLLAIRRMRDLLNSESNAKNILDLLRSVEPSEDSRLEMIEKEKLVPPNENFEEILNSRRGSGRSIKSIINAEPNNFKIQELIKALNENTNGERPLISSVTPLPPEKRQNKSPHEGPVDPKTLKKSQSITSSINNLINSTINGAIIRLLNKQTEEKANEENVDVNIRGVSVFPLNSKDLEILLQSNPSNVEENIGPLSNEKVRSLQILHRLIELNDLRQKVERHIDSSISEIKNNGDTSPPSKNGTRPIKVTPPSVVSRIGVPSLKKKEAPDSQGRRIPKHFRSAVPRSNRPKVISQNITSSAQREKKTTRERSVESSRSQLRASASIPAHRKQPDPAFAVMVKTDGNSKAASRPLPRSMTSRGRHQHRPRAVESQTPFPIREQVAVQPGKSKGRGNSAVIRSWTHMDSHGTLSRGKIHSDGSFTFTNCRPVEVCSGENAANASPDEKSTQN